MFERSSSPKKAWVFWQYCDLLSVGVQVPAQKKNLDPPGTHPSPTFETKVRLDPQGIIHSLPKRTGRSSDSSQALPGAGAAMPGAPAMPQPPQTPQPPVRPMPPSRPSPAVGSVFAVRIARHMDCTCKTICIIVYIYNLFIWGLEIESR